MITIKESKNRLKYEKIWKGLFEFNKGKNTHLNRVSDYKSKAINLYAYDGKEIIGGILCECKYHWLYVDSLYVDERMRGKDIGTKLLQEAEKYAKEHNLRGLHVKTFDFQAKPFYEKCGFEVCGCIENMPPGSKMWILKKEV